MEIKEKAYFEIYLNGKSIFSGVGENMKFSGDYTMKRFEGSYTYQSYWGVTFELPVYYVDFETMGSIITQGFFTLEEGNTCEKL